MLQDISGAGWRRYHGPQKAGSDQILEDTGAARPQYPEHLLGHAEKSSWQRRRTWIHGESSTQHGKFRMETGLLPAT